MPLDPRTPVIVGVGQLSERPADPAAAPEPAEMMAEALRRAEADAATPGLLAAADSISVVELMSWRYADPGRAVAGRLGIEPARSVLTTTGGNSPQSLVNATSAAIQAGDLRVALLVGGEALHSRSAARRAGVQLGWTGEPDGTAPDEIFGIDRPGNHDAELARGLAAPIQVYPLFENALRHAAGESIEEHQRKVSELWAGFARVAAGNPYAWTRSAPTAEEIRTVGPDNRMVGFPYPKLMNSNISVDQAAGLAICSVEAARELGVPEERWVFPHSGTDGHDHWFVSERADLHSSPAIRLGGSRALELAGATAADLAHVDLYSCFPSAVQIAAAELGLGLDQELTVTGGLAFAGGPLNNYVMHAIATMVDRLRSDRGARGLCTALGWYATKHAFGVYSTDPPVEGFRAESVQAAVDATPSVEVTVDHEGPVTVETYTVMHERDGSPSTGFAACRTAEGRRTWAITTDSDLMAAMTGTEFCGRPGRVGAGGVLDVD